MKIPHWLARIVPGTQFRSPVPTRRSRRRGGVHRDLQPLQSLESLEDRTLLSTITVTSLVDTTATDGQVSLREALQAAETDMSVDGSTAGSGADTIVFATDLVDSGDAVVRITEYDTGLDDGEFGATAFAITTDVTITGPSGDDGITLARSFSAAFRLFHVQSGGVLKLENLTLSNGLAEGGNGGANNAGGGGAAGLGGAIFNQGTLTLLSSTLSGNQAIGGNGGIQGGNDGGSGGGGLGTNGGNGSNPTGGSGGSPNGGSAGTSGGVGGGGGGGSREGGHGGGGGFGGGGGGGAYRIQGTAGTVFGGNGGAGGFGGGGGGGGGARAIQNAGTESPGTGGAGGFGGGSGSAGGTGLSAPGGAGGGGAGMGGAIFNYGGTVNMINSTISGNTARGGDSASSYAYGSADGQGEGGDGLGGGIFNRNGGVTVINSTIANNTVAGGDSALDGSEGSGNGGGIFTLGDGGSAFVMLKNTIVADSSAGDDFHSATINGGTSNTSGNGNLIESHTGFIGAVASTDDPGLEELADNGGPTWTHAIGVGSPALDAGSMSVCGASEGADCLLAGSSALDHDHGAAAVAETDQRGGSFARISDGDLDGNAIIDIGAFELLQIDFADAPDIDPGTGERHYLSEVGEDFRISVTGPDGNGNFFASDADAAYNATDHEYLVVWRADDDETPVVDNTFEIFGQRYDAATGEALGDRIRISQLSEVDGNFDVFDPAVTWNSTTNQYLVVFVGPFGAVSANEVYGQLLSNAGVEVGSDFRISDMGDDDNDAAYRAQTPDVVYNATGNEYLVVWSGDDDALGDNRSEIFGQRITAAGAETGDNDFRISHGASANTEFDAFVPTTAWNRTDNEYLVVWHGDWGTDNAVEVQGQRLSSSGAELGSDFRISDMGSSDSDTSFRGEDADATYNSSENEYFVVWSGSDDSDGQVSNEFEIFGQRLTNDGDAVGENDFRISDAGDLGDAGFASWSPSVTYNTTQNTYVAVWYGDDSLNNEFEIFAQQLDHTGAETNPHNLQISQQGADGVTTFQARNPAIAYNSTGNEFLVVWHGSSGAPLANNEFEIYGRRLESRQIVDYGTLAADGGPSHLVRVGLQMGARIDFENIALQSFDADGDDLATTDDEDGLVDPATDLDVVVGGTPTVRVTVTNTTGSEATLFGWIDYNGDGVFSNDDERASVTVPDGTMAGAVTLTFPSVPANSEGAAVARFRLSTDVAAQNATGAAGDGEVEDYALVIDGLVTPGTPSLQTPAAGGTITDTTPEYTWTAAVNADRYEIWVNDLTTGTSGVLRNANISGTSFTPSTELSIDHSYIWTVRAISEDGTAGDWAAHGTFTVRVAAPELTAPTAGGVATDLTPAFTWDAVPGADHYDLWVNDLTTGTSQVIRQASLSGTSYTPQSDLDVDHSYLWTVRAFSENGIPGNWGLHREFTIRVAAPELTSPASGGTTDDLTPTFTWNASPGADHYDLWVNDLTTGTSQVIRQTNLSGTSYTPESDLELDHTYLWTVRAFSENGVAGEWAPHRMLSLHVGQPALTSPVAVTTADATPTFTWSAVAGADRYDLWLNDLTAGTGQVIRQTNLSGTSYTPESDLELDHAYLWTVRAFSESGVAGEWAAHKSFTVSVAQPTVTSFDGGATDDATPTFTWSAITGASRYDLWVNDLTTGTIGVIRNTNVGGESFTPTTPLIGGHTYIWTVRTFNDSGDAGDWAAHQTFTVTLGRPTLTESLGGTVDDATPTFTWSAVTDAARYDLWVNDSTTGTVGVIRNTNVAGTSFTPTTPLAGGHTYIWTVRAVTENGVAGEWAAHQTFSVRVDRPTLTSPVGTTTSDTTPTFIWKAVTGAARYDVWVNNLTTGTVGVIRNQHVVGNSFTPSTPLTAGHRYIWTVRAFNANGDAGDWAAHKTFTVAAAEDVRSEAILGLGPADPESGRKRELTTPGPSPARDQSTHPLREGRERFASADVAPPVRYSQSKLSPTAARLVAGRSGQPMISDQPAAQVVDEVMAEWSETNWWLDDPSAAASRPDGQDDGSAADLAWAALPWLAWRRRPSSRRSGKSANG